MPNRIHHHNADDNAAKLRKAAEKSAAGPSPKQVQRAIEEPSADTLTPDVVNSLQATHGNNFVSRLVQRMSDGPGLSMPIQAKLSVTAADDKYENEADNVARDVMGAIQSGEAQRMEEEEMQMKRDSIQREDEEELQMKRDSIQRMEEEEMQMKRKSLQREDVSFEDGGDVSSAVENKIESSRGGGKPLDDNTRSNMEGAFGADFSGVRVHTGSEADTLNQSVQAKAFTTGSDIFFRSGEYNPGSSGGQELLAHELTHTIQQGAASVQKKEDE